MVKPFEEAAFQASKNEIIGPILSRFGYHVIHVRDKRINEDGNDEVLASHVLIKIDISPSTLNELKRDATLFSYDAQDNGFDSAIKTHKLLTSKVEKLEKNDITVKGLGNLRSMVHFAFNNKLSSVSEILENDKYYAVCILDSIIPEGFKNIEEVESQIRTVLKK